MSSANARACLSGSLASSAPFATAINPLYVIGQPHRRHVDVAGKLASRALAPPVPVDVVAVK